MNKCLNKGFFEWFRFGFDRIIYYKHIMYVCVCACMCMLWSTVYIFLKISWSGPLETWELEGSTQYLSCSSNYALLDTDL